MAPYVTKDACRRAARTVVATLSQVGAGDVEDLAQHLGPVTGFLSIDVINAIGAAYTWRAARPSGQRCKEREMGGRS